MNIFVLSRNPGLAARMHCDKHVVKMILESAQMLSTAHHHYNSEYKTILYKPTHIKHPCTQWVLKSSQNYWWLFRLFTALLNEYEQRYKREHKCKQLKVFLTNNPCPIGFRTKFAQAMPEEYKSWSAIRAYRRYYWGEKRRFAKWKTYKPYWWRAREIKTFINN